MCLFCAAAFTLSVAVLVCDYVKTCQRVHGTIIDGREECNDNLGPGRQIVQLMQNSDKAL